MKTLFTILLFIFTNFQWKYPDRFGGYQVGDYANDFRLKNIDGKMISMSDFTNAKGFIIVFTCNTCPFAILYEQRLINLYNTYAQQGYPLIAINPNDATEQPGDSYESMQKRAHDKNYPFPYLIDETQEITKNFGATSTPNLYILKKEGEKYKVMYKGAIDNNPEDGAKVTIHYVDDAMKQIISGQPVKNPDTNAIGCGIRWKM